MTLWTLVQASLLFVNAFAILNNDRFLEKCGWGFSQIGGNDGAGPGPSALKTQVIGFLFAAAYLRVPLVIFNALTIFVKILFG